MRQPVLGATVVLALILFFSAVNSLAGSNVAFRSEFMHNYAANRFQQQVVLVKKNRDIIPDEVSSLITDAMGADKSFDHKMKLLDIASAMASMHKFWNGDEKPLLEVETIQGIELEKEKLRVAEEQKWTKYEKGIGNFLMKEHQHQMEAEGLAPVVFPHWVHRTWFKCKVCHQDIFIMHRGANDIDHNKDGKQCWACHNNRIAFSDEGNCQRCHQAGRPEADRLYDISRADHAKIKEVATRLGAEWNPERLPKGMVPVDRFGYIDWIELKNSGAFNPIGFLEGIDDGQKEEFKDDLILFEPMSEFVNDVVFSHKIHSSWIKCSTCHPAVFKDELGGNDIKMVKMAGGEFCGHCHGKVSFTFADCGRCHSQPKGEPVSGAILRRSKP